MPRYTAQPRRARYRGFTLIELLIVLVIIGLLVAILAPSWTKTVGKANTSALRSDLHNLVIAQEQYFYENQTYTNDVNALRFQATKNVSVVFTAVAPGGWAATATHAHANPIICGVFVGNAPKPLASTVADGQIGCQ
jgi:prepilin-type N-terminal cleavage/methylation domain-containing protein